MNGLSHQFGATLRKEHREIREALAELSDAFLWGVPEYFPSILRGMLAQAGPHVRYEEEAIYPALTEIVGEGRVERLLSESTQFKRSVERLGQLATEDVWSNEDAEEGIELVRSLLRHVEDCDELVATVEQLPEEKVRRILRMRQGLQRSTA